MKLPIILSALLLSASPTFAQFDRDNNCIRNKESEMQRYKKEYQMAYQQVLNTETTSEIARQMEEAGLFPNFFSSKEKSDAAYKLLTDELRKMKRNIEASKTYPDCSELQGGKGQ